MPKGRLPIDRLPVGRSIDQAEFDRRHRLATLTLGVFVPVVFVIGLVSGYSFWHSALETAGAAILAIFARSTKGRLAGSLATSAGLVGLSTALVHFTGGLGESHLVWLVAIGLIGLYVDTRPLLVGLGLIAIGHVAFSIGDSSLFFEHAGGQENPLRWSALHLLILAISTGPMLANWLTMEAWSEQARLKERAQAHTLRHRAMVAADATGRTGELSVSSASARKAMSEADELVASINEGTNEVSRLVSKVATLAQDADVMSSSTKDTIEHLSEQSSAIAGLVEVIDDIAARTNLLALNASIEAARAGEAGKGFAVVAQEVKDLATTTSEATEQISDLTTTVQIEMDEANRRMAEVSDTVRSIANLQRQVDATMVDQTEASARMSRQVNEAATEMNEIIEGIDDLNELLEEDAADDPTDAFNAIHGTEAVSLSELVR